MCGIFGIIGENQNISPAIIHGLLKLAYRGYDSSGVCLQTPSGHVIQKTLGIISNLTTPLPHASSGIGHSRWATHGICSILNAHPHTSGEVSIVHNGIIQNHLWLKERLRKKGYFFQSDTDSEVIAHLLHDLIKQYSPKQALEKAAEYLEGRYAFLAMLKSVPDTIFSLSNELPLIVGKNHNTICIASDLRALANCQSYIRLQDSTPLILNKSLKHHSEFSPMPSEIKHQLSQPEKDFTLQEIMAQAYLPQQIKAQSFIGIKRHRPIIILACGSSYHCGLVFQNWLHAVGIFPFISVASEAKSLPFHHFHSPLIIAISQSGETADTIIALKKAKLAPDHQTVAITNVPSSSLASICDIIIPLSCGPEIGVASTKAVTAQLLTLYRLKNHLQEQPITLPESLMQNIQQVLTKPELLPFVNHLLTFKHIICLGKGALLPIAMEIALKIKELAYIHAEALPAGELKHGPLALIDSNVLCLVIDDQQNPLIQGCISEIEARSGNVLLISPYANHQHHIKVPQDDLTAIYINMIGQRLAYLCATQLKHTVDTPRNLAKSVTVE